MLERFNKTTRLIIGICLAVVIWIIGMLIGQEQTVIILDPEGGLRNIINRSPSIKVSLMLDAGAGRVYVYQDQQLNYAQTVFDLLKKVDQPGAKLNFNYNLNPASGELKSFSLLNQSNVQNGPEWLLWLNNHSRTEPLNQVKLKARDVIELKYIKLREDL